jgi:RecA-family ATPase
MSAQPLSFEELLVKKHAEEQQRKQVVKKGPQKPEIPAALSMAELRALNVTRPEMLIANLTPTPGASLLVGASKSGKTILAVQKAIAVASGHHLFDFYRVKQGPAMIVEQDDPAGAASIKDIVIHTGVTDDIPLFIQPRVPFSIGPAFLDWLSGEIAKRKLRFVVLDSYTALRGNRGSGVDIVKAEQGELTQLDSLAKQTGCAIEIIHHASKGSAALDWSERAGGTYAMSAATEAQIFISRFADLDAASPERLVRVRGRHCADVEMVLRFRADTLDYVHVLEGGAASYYPLLLQIRNEFGNRPFTPKDFYQTTGMARATAFRQIERLSRVGALTRRGHGEYSLVDLR